MSIIQIGKEESKSCECCGRTFVMTGRTSYQYYCSGNCKYRMYEMKDYKRYLFKHAKQRAKKRGYKFLLLTKDDIPDIPEYCPVLGIKLEPRKQKSGSKFRGGQPNSVSLHRIDSSKGYEVGNLVIVSLRANNLLGDSTLEELEKMVEFQRRVNCSS